MIRSLPTRTAFAPSQLRSRESDGRVPAKLLAGMPDRGWQRRLGAGLLAMHGVAHLVGTSEAWATLGENGAVRYLFEQWHLTTTPMRVTAGVVWALVAAGFLATAVAVWANRLRWREATLLMASVSLVLCLLALPQAAMGLIVNGSLIAVVTRLLALQQKAGR